MVRGPPEAVPVYLALVDLCCEEEALELIRSALQAALEALPAAARFGLVTFSHRVLGSVWPCFGAVWQHSSCFARGNAAYISLCFYRLHTLPSRRTILPVRFRLVFDVCISTKFRERY